MKRESWVCICTCVPIMQLAAVVLLVVTMAATSGGRGFLDTVLAAKNIVSVSTTVTRTKFVTPDIDYKKFHPTETNRGGGMVAPNASSEWAADDLQQAYSPEYHQIGCFHDGSSFNAARRMARRLSVSRGEGAPAPLP